jgi:hypothetical protein
MCASVKYIIALYAFRHPREDGSPGALGSRFRGNDDLSHANLEGSVGSRDSKGRCRGQRATPLKPD